MKAHCYYSEAERCDIVQLEIGKNEYLSSQEIISAIRINIAKEITSKIMEKLGPEIDKIFGAA